MKQPPAVTHFKWSALISTALAALLSGCQSTQNPRDTFSTEQRNSNRFFQTWSSNSSDAEFQKKLARSAFRLFRGSLPGFLEESTELTRTSGILSQFDDLWIHGDFHPQQMAWINGRAVLEDFDTVDRGPWWLDVVRMDVGAQVISQENSLKPWNEGVCLMSYRDALNKYNANTKTVPIQGQPLKPEKSSTWSTPSEVKDFQKASISDVPDDLKTAWAAYLSSLNAADPNLPTLKEMRMANLGTGSHKMKKYLSWLSDDTLVELKQLEARPLGAYAPSVDAGKNTPCVRFQKGASVLAQSTRASETWDCWSYNDESYAVLKWSKNYGGVDGEDFKSEESLKNHVQWMCSHLAQVHARQWTPAQLKKTKLALKFNRALLDRLIEFENKATHEVLHGHRMILGESSH